MAKKTANYDEALTYGVYQIYAELNTSYKDDMGEMVFDYPELNGVLNTLKEYIKHYISEIMSFCLSISF